jgi:thiamine pyrophosphate-dependent acetolactate synthase large subunit-like protein
VTRTGGAAVVEALLAHGVRDVFGIPGTHNLEIYRALAEHADEIRHVTPRHEQGGGYAADGYYRATGRPGVLITTSGPGVTNAITAIATAYADSIPMLVISPGIPRGYERADIGWLHEVKDQQAALASVADRSVRVADGDGVVEAIADAFARWAVERPRPVHIEIPVDVLEGPWTPSGPVEPRTVPRPAAADATAIGKAADLLGHASRPLIIAGGGARRAATEVRALAERLGAPVLTTVNGKGVLDEDHPLSVGASIRLPAAHALIADSDVLLVIGSELGDSDLWGGRAEPAGPAIRIDIDAAQLHKNLRATVPILADAASAVSALLTALPARQPAADRAVAARAATEAEAAQDGDPWRPLQEALSRALPEDVIVAGDSSRVTYYGTVHFWPFDQPGRLLYPTGYATLGYGLPAAIGAAVGTSGRPVVAVVGDGAFMFSIQELTTAVEQRLPLPVIVVDNGGYGEIKAQMLDRGITPLGVDLTRPDFVAMARSMGCHGVAVADAGEAAAEAAKALTADRPTLIYLVIDA